MINNKQTNIVDSLVENFSISEDEAKQKLESFLNEMGEQFNQK